MAKDEPMLVMYSKNKAYPENSKEPILRHTYQYDVNTEEGEKFLAERLARGYVLDPSELGKPTVDKDQQIEDLKAEISRMKESTEAHGTEFHPDFPDKTYMATGDKLEVVENQEMGTESKVVCPHCGFEAASDFGLKAHIRAKHKEV